MSLSESVLEGKYEVLRKISEGGMGTVYLVRHVHLDERRVIKVIRRQFAEDEELRQRFLREAQIAIKLRHPKIAEIFDFAVSKDGTPFIVMEYIDGRTLQDLLRESGPPPVALALEVAVQTLEALDYLHRMGFVHRDISPDNIMLTRDFEGSPLVKLIDLGIVKHLDQDSSVTLTGTGMFMGKALYSSPEQFGQGQVAPRSDLYSFGIVLYELLTARCPMEGKTLSELVAAHLFKPPLSFNETDPDGRIPEDLRQIVMRSLAKDAAERMASAREFIDLLKPVRERFDQEEMKADLTMDMRTRPEAGPSEEFDAHSAAASNARLLMDQGRFEKARAELRRVLDVKPGHSEALRILEMTEEMLESRAEAVRQDLITRRAQKIERLLKQDDLEAATAELSRRLERVRADRGEKAKSEAQKEKAGPLESVRQGGVTLLGRLEQLDPESETPSDVKHTVMFRPQMEAVVASTNDHLVEAWLRLQNSDRISSILSTEVNARLLLTGFGSFGGTSLVRGITAKLMHNLAHRQRDKVLVLRLESLEPPYYDLYLNENRAGTLTDQMEEDHLVPLVEKAITRIAGESSDPAASVPRRAPRCPISPGRS